MGRRMTRLLVTSCWCLVAKLNPMTYGDMAVTDTHFQGIRMKNRLESGGCEDAGEYQARVVAQGWARDGGITSPRRRVRGRRPELTADLLSRREAPRSLMDPPLPAAVL
jgi:hypothetical protein